MRHKKKRGMEVYFQKDIREAVYERFMAVCEEDAQAYAELTEELDRSLENADEEEYLILCFDPYGYPYMMIVE